MSEQKIVVWSALSPEERRKLLSDHRKWVDGSGGTRANLRGADLRRANLHGANLRGADLCGADLYGADLRGADLRGANLHGANLRRANLHGANLRGADLRRANLHGANLRGADLYGADLRGADLRRANLRGADLRGADLYGADLRGADLYGADGNKIKIKHFYICGPQGSRGDWLCAFSCDDGNVYFSTGCAIAVEKNEFLSKVKVAHGNSPHGKAYAAAVKHCVVMLKYLDAVRD